MLAYLERNDAHSSRCRICAPRCATANVSPPACNSGRAILHSTGQAYKGGPNSGVFLQITADAAADVNIPGRKASFGVIEAAQARGDLRVLAERGRRVLRAHLSHDLDAGIAAIGEAARAALR